MLRCLINVGELRGRWERFPAEEDHPLAQYPLAARLLRVTEHDGPEAPESERRLLQELGCVACVGVPVFVEGRTWGLLDVFGFEEAAPLTGRSVPFLEAVAGQVGAATAGRSCSRG